MSDIYDFDQRRQEMSQLNQYKGGGIGARKQARMDARQPEQRAGISGAGGGAGGQIGAPTPTRMTGNQTPAGITPMDQVRRMEAQPRQGQQAPVTGAGLNGLQRGSFIGARSDAQNRAQNPALFENKLASGHGAGLTEMYLRAAELQRGNKLREQRNQLQRDLGVGAGSTKGGLATLQGQINQADAAYDQRVAGGMAQGLAREQMGSAERIAGIEATGKAAGRSEQPSMFRQELDRQGAKNLIDLRESAQQSKATLGQLQSMNEILRDNTTGFYRDKLGSLDRYLGGALGIRDPKQAFTAFSNFLTAQSAQNVLTGVLTQRDMELFKQAMPSYDKPQQVNAYLIDFYTKAMQAGIDRVNAMDQYAAQYGTLEGFDDSQFRTMQLDTEALTDPQKALALLEQSGGTGQQQEQRGGIGSARQPAPAYDAAQVSTMVDRAVQELGLTDPSDPVQAARLRDWAIDQGIDLESL